MKDERKTKKQLIAELEVLRGENARLHRQGREGGDSYVLERRLAVERVRAEGLAMDSSKGLLKLVGMMREEMLNLGMDIVGSAIRFLEEEEDGVHIRRNYSAIRNPRKFGISWTAPHLSEFNEEIAVAEINLPNSREQIIIDSWSRGEVLSTVISGEDLALRFRAVTESWELDRPYPIPEGTEWNFIHVPFEHGVVSFVVSTLVQEHVTFVQELTEALSLGYVRYLDFQRLEDQAETLEEQAEQARRERAVERVRAEAMAMRQSDDMLKVAAVMFREMLELGIETGSCVIQFIDDQSGYLRNYAAFENPKKQGIDWTYEGLIEYNDDIAIICAMIESHISDFREKWEESKRKGEIWNHTVGREQFATDLKKEEEMLGYSHPTEVPDGSEFTITHVPFAYGTVTYHEADFSQDHAEMVSEMTNALALSYLRFLDFQKVDEAQRQLIDELEEELQTAHDMQMGLMPTESPHIEGFDIAGRCLPANHVGGDFFQYFPLLDDGLALAMADVTGHAMKAAVPVMMFCGMLRSQMELGDALDRLFGRLNRTLCQSLDKRTFVCFTMGELDTETRTFHLANGGCPYPYHFRESSGEISELQLDAYPLAIRPDSEYETMDIQLDARDRIIFCSDGIVEAENAEGEIYGFERTAETIRQGCREDLSAEALIDHLIGAVKAFAEETPQGDDMTCVVLKVEG